METRSALAALLLGGALAAPWGAASAAADSPLLTADCLDASVACSLEQGVPREPQRTASVGPRAGLVLTNDDLDRAPEELGRPRPRREQSADEPRARAPRADEPRAGKAPAQDGASAFDAPGSTPAWEEAWTFAGEGGALATTAAEAERAGPRGPEECVERAVRAGARLGESGRVCRALFGVGASTGAGD